MRPCRIQVLSEHRMLVDALAWRLGGEPDLRMGPDAGPDAVPDVVVVDRASVGRRFGSVLDELAGLADRCRVVVLADVPEGDDAAADALAAVRAGVLAWLPPTCGADELVHVLRHVALGHAFYPPAVLGGVLAGLRAGAAPDPEAGGPFAALTSREREVLACLVDGWSGRAIAERLDMADTTVRTHTTRIFRKLGVHSRLEAVRYARDAGFASPERAPVGRPRLVNPSTPPYVR